MPDSDHVSSPVLFRTRSDIRVRGFASEGAEPRSRVLVASFCWFCTSLGTTPGLRHPLFSAPGGAGFFRRRDGTDLVHRHRKQLLDSQPVRVGFQIQLGPPDGACAMVQSRNLQHCQAGNAAFSAAVKECRQPASLVASPGAHYTFGGRTVFRMDLKGMPGRLCLQGT